MSTTHERVDGVVDAGLNPLRAILERPRQAFVAEGPPSAAVPRHRIVRLLALVLDNADEFVDAMKADFGSRPKAGSWIVVHQGPRHDLGDRAHQIPCASMDARDQAYGCGGPQRNGCLPRQGRIRRVQPLPDRGGHRPAVLDHGAGSAAVSRSNARRHERDVAHGAQPNAPSSQEPLIACSLAHR